MRSLRLMWLVSAVIYLSLGWAQLPAHAKDAAIKDAAAKDAKAPAPAANVYPPEVLKQLSELNGVCKSSGKPQQACNCTTSEIQSRYTAEELITLMTQKSTQPRAMSPLPIPTGNMLEDGRAAKAYLEQNGMLNRDGSVNINATTALMQDSLPAPIVAIMKSCDEKFAK